MAKQFRRGRRAVNRNTPPRAEPITLELEISTVAHGGVFVARNEGRVIFVSDTLPGERVVARVDDVQHDRYWRAETVRVIEPSPDRQAHIWSAASVERAPEDRAGGAEFGHIALARQRALKQQVVTEALSRMAKLDLPVTVESVSGDDVTSGAGWRSRVRLQVSDGGVVGPFASRSHHVIEVDDLPLATREVAEAAPLGVRTSGADSIEVVAPIGRLGMVLRNETHRARPEPVTIIERVGDREFRLDARGFWQVHRGAPAVLTEAVQSAIDDAVFAPDAANLDLYGGVGLLAAAVGDRFGRTTNITTVESSEGATDYAGANLAEWVGARAVTARVEHFVQGLAADASARERARQRAATVVLDPPRSGAGRDVVNSLIELAPAQLVYVACDPVAFARDVGFFGVGGYQIRSLRAFDLFPNTHHVEVVALLTR
jgi:tRNA/tmRNA/rRNA uracil-C5-methylase (TrmA/RlmC/RlmD family)